MLTLASRALMRSHHARCCVEAAGESGKPMKIAAKATIRQGFFKAGN
jgi:hypothetical protein